MEQSSAKRRVEIQFGLGEKIKIKVTLDTPRGLYDKSLQHEKFTA